MADVLGIGPQHEHEYADRDFVQLSTLARWDLINNDGQYD